MKRTLPSKPSLEHLKKQAKELLAAYRAGDLSARDSFAPYFAADARVGLTQAQLVLAREYGAESWRALARRVTPDPIQEFVDAALGGQIEQARKLWKAERITLRRSPAVAALVGDVEAVREMLDADPGLTDRAVGPNDRPLLGYACYSRLVNDGEFETGIVNVVELLLGRGADPNNAYMAVWSNQECRQTPLYGAAGVVNHAGLTRRLLDAGADPNDGETAPDHRGGETLYHSCDFPGHNECLRMVLAAGADQSAKDYCLKRKLDFEDIEGALMFIEFGADPNVSHTRTALSHAILRGRSAQLIRRLIEAGADPNVKNDDGTSPYITARRLGRRDVADLLVEFGATTESTPRDDILIAATDDDIEELKRIAREHPEVFETSTHGRQAEDGLPLGSSGDAMNDLARLGRTKGLEALLDLGIDVGIRNSWSETPLHWAACAGQLETVKLLLSRGAPLDVRDIHNNGTPMGWCCWSSQYWQHEGADYVGCVKAFLAVGATPDRPIGSPEVIALLRKR